MSVAEGRTTTEGTSKVVPVYLEYSVFIIRCNDYTSYDGVGSSFFEFEARLEKCTSKERVSVVVFVTKAKKHARQLLRNQFRAVARFLPCPCLCGHDSEYHRHRARESTYRGDKPHPLVTSMGRIDRYSRSHFLEFYPSTLVIA